MKCPVCSHGKVYSYAKGIVICPRCLGKGFVNKGKPAKKVT
jgi:ribosomal protein L37AE/L43A